MAFISLCYLGSCDPWLTFSFCFLHYLHLEESMASFNGISKSLGLKRCSDEQDGDLYGINELPFCRIS
uniref:Uncharacterized protein n=1 Tax=Populus trichocarpa TaxID=3694 RepID=A0A2K2B2Q7_POPTR